MATRKEVAQKAGISESVVSYVINNSNYVNAKTRSRVEKAIEELGYRPNIIARSLKTSHSNHIAFICNDFNNPFFSQLAADVTKSAYENGYLLSINDVGYDDTRIELLLQYRVDALFIVSDLFTTEEINKFIKQGIKVLLFANKKYEGLDSAVTQMDIDIYGGMVKLMHYLFAKGHKHFAFISSARFKTLDNETGTYQNYRYKAFIECVEQQGLTGEAYGIETVTDYKSIISIVDNLIKKKEVTAIVAGNDAIAFIIIEHIQSQGLRVPEDIAVTGFDNVRFSNIFSPSLTTVDLHLDRMSKTAMDMLLHLLKNQPYTHIVWNTDLRIGNSS